MPKGFDERHRGLLRRILADAASDVPNFTRTAETGGFRTDEGLHNLLPAELTLHEKKSALRRAIVEFLDRGDTPTVEQSAGDADMALDAGTYYHFRVAVEGVRLFVKVLLDEEDAQDPTVRVISVKRDDRAWK